MEAITASTKEAGQWWLSLSPTGTFPVNSCSDLTSPNSQSSGMLATTLRATAAQTVCCYHTSTPAIRKCFICFEPFVGCTSLPVMAFDCQSVETSASREVKYFLYENKTKHSLTDVLPNISQVTGAVSL